MKSQTLIFEWSGANYLITVSSIPTVAVKRAVEARLANVNELYVNGYKNFILFNLPDLSKTPRYQRASEKHRLKKQLTTLIYFSTEKLNHSEKNIPIVQSCYLTHMRN